MGYKIGEVLPKSGKSIKTDEDAYMPYAEWNDELSNAIEKIDGQHKVLIQTLNDLNDAYGSPDRQSAAGTCLVKMKDYLKEHFSEEEQFM
jgi:hemerythrin